MRKPKPDLLDVVEHIVINIVAAIFIGILILIAGGALVGTVLMLMPLGV